MEQSLTYVIELAVGIGCALAAITALRTPRLRWLCVLLLGTGAAAIVHAAIRLLS